MSYWLTIYFQRNYCLNLSTSTQFALLTVYSIGDWLIWCIAYMTFLREELSEGSWISFLISSVLNLLVIYGSFKRLCDTHHVTPECVSVSCPPPMSWWWSTQIMSCLGLIIYGAHTKLCRLQQDNIEMSLVRFLNATKLHLLSKI